MNNDSWKKWFGPKDEKDSKGDKDKKNENLDEYSDDDNENKEEEDNSGLRKTEEGGYRSGWLYGFQDAMVIESEL